jgi:hypothetical protein
MRTLRESVCVCVCVCLFLDGREGVRFSTVVEKPKNPSVGDVMCVWWF